MATKAAQAQTETVTTDVNARDALMAKLGVAKTRKLTENQLKLSVGKPVAFKVTSALYEGKKIDDKKDPATLLNGIDLETGEECTVVVPAVMQGVFADDYQDDAYVGKSFMVEKLAKDDPDKKYFNYRIEELDIK